MAKYTNYVMPYDITSPSPLETLLVGQEYTFKWYTPEEPKKGARFQLLNHKGGGNWELVVKGYDTGEISIKVDASHYCEETGAIEYKVEPIEGK